MRYFHCTWAHSLPDEPVWMACEVTEEKNVTRMIEHFAIGWTDYREASREDCESLVHQPFDASAAALDETMTLRGIPAEEFEALWRRRTGEADPLDG